MTDEERLRADTLDELLGKEMLDNITLRAEIERLTAQRDKWCKAYEGCANEFLALRAENERLKAQQIIWADTETLIAENERLREALQQYAEIEGPPYHGTPYLARAALQSKGSTDTTEGE